jgi:hypothetical protein
MHLTALKRSGLIRDWYDHKIEPGSAWNVEIQEAMERAGIILLLVSADFVASNYINNVEVPFALNRHQSGHARVIPVLLRPVEWQDLPFAKLQVLPTGARAVTSWANQDEAFSDIAGRLRELLYNQRSREVAAAEPSVAVTRVTQERVLDAAIALSVVVDEPTDIVTMVRTTESTGLKAILQVDRRTYSPTSEDVQSKMFELDFPSDSSGVILPATLELALESPGFDPARQRKKIRVPPKGDSDVSVFMITPKRAGILRLNLQVLSANVEIGSRMLVTTSVSVTHAPPSLSYGVTSLSIKPSPPRHVDRRKAEEENRRRTEEERNRAAQEQQHKEAEFRRKAEEELVRKRSEHQVQPEAEEENQRRIDQEANRARPRLAPQDVSVFERLAGSARRLYAGGAVIVVIGLTVMTFWFVAPFGGKDADVNNAAQVATKVEEYIKAAGAYHDRGEYSAALAELAKAKSLDPSNKAVQAELERTKKACLAEQKIGSTSLRCD